MATDIYYNGTQYPGRTGANRFGTYFFAVKPPSLEAPALARSISDLLSASDNYIKTHKKIETELLSLSDVRGTTFTRVFSPPNSANLLLWLRADTLPPSWSDGQSIATWIDDSGNQNTAYQATSVRQPLYYSNQLNGKPAVKFDGTNTYLNLINLFEGSRCTVFIVANATTQNSYRALFSQQRFFIHSRLNVSPNNWGAYTNVDLNSGTSLTTTFKLLRTSIRATNCITFRTNDDTVGTKTTGGAFGTFTPPRIGAHSAEVQFHNGYIAEIALYGTTLSDSDMALWETYFDGKYDLFTPH